MGAPPELADSAALPEQESEVRKALDGLLDQPAEPADLASGCLGGSLPDHVEDAGRVLLLIDLPDLLHFLGG